MAKRWGSCSKSGRISLNIKLIRVPLYGMDYVIMPELCHLKVHRHDNEYYKILAKYMPDWKERKKRLEKFTYNAFVLVGGGSGIFLMRELSGLNLTHCPTGGSSPAQLLIFAGNAFPTAVWVGMDLKNGGAV